MNVATINLKLTETVFLGYEEPVKLVEKKFAEFLMNK